MEPWNIDYLPEAAREVLNLDKSVVACVQKAIIKVSQNPLPRFMGGYGDALAHRHGRNLSGLYKIKLKSIGIRVVYALKEDNGVMLIVVVGVREDEKVYKDADARRRKYNL